MSLAASLNNFYARHEKILVGSSRGRLSEHTVEDVRETTRSGSGSSSGEDSWPQYDVSPQRRRSSSCNGYGGSSDPNNNYGRPFSNGNPFAERQINDEDDFGYQSLEVRKSSRKSKRREDKRRSSNDISGFFEGERASFGAHSSFFDGQQYEAAACPWPVASAAPAPTVTWANFAAVGFDGEGRPHQWQQQQQKQQQQHPLHEQWLNWSSTPISPSAKKPWCDTWERPLSQQSAMSSPPATTNPFAPWPPRNSAFVAA